MKIDRTLLCRGLLFGTVSLCAGAAHAAGLVTDCQNFGTVGTLGTLADAVNGGGLVTFNCSSGSGTIVVPQMSVTSGSLTIDASASATPITLDGNNANRHFSVNNNASLTLRRLTLQNGRATGAAVGGSIESINAALTVDGCVFRNNALIGNGNNRGGAIAIVPGANALPRMIENSTFEGNSVTSTNIPSGGALHVTDASGNTVVRNSTFHGNSVNGTNGNEHGGAIAWTSGGTVHHVTVTGNAVNGTASSVGGGGFLVSGPVTVSNSVLAGNSSTGNGPDVRTPGAQPFLGSYNLIGNGNTSNFTTFGPTNLVGTTASPLDPLVAPLGSFGGPTQTRLPLPASAASNAIPAANCPLLTDQRGAARTAGQPCTMGAVEPDWVLTATGGTPQSTLVNTAFSPPLAVELADQLDQHVAGIQVDFTAPPSGASATLGAPSATTDALGAAQVTATANAIPGSYQVNATTTGVNAAAAFDLTNLPPTADLAVTKTDGVATATPGGAVTYTITASNGGPQPVTGGTVTDTFPPTLTCTWTCMGAGGSTCTAAGSGNITDTVNLPVGSGVTYTASCTISLAATGTLVNTATVVIPGGVDDPTPGNNSATDTDTLTAGPAAAVSSTKTATGTFTVGGTVTYTVTLNNTGTGDQTDNPGSELSDALPPQLALVSATATSGTAVADLGTNTVTWNGALAAGGSVTITIAATILPGTEGQSVANQGVIAFDADLDGSNESTASTDDPDAPGSANPTSFLVGGIGGVPAIPTLPASGLLLLSLALATLGLAALRRHPS